MIFVVCPKCGRGIIDFEVVEMCDFCRYQESKKQKFDSEGKVVKYAD